MNDERQVDSKLNPYSRQDWIQPIRDKMNFWQVSVCRHDGTPFLFSGVIPGSLPSSFCHFFLGQNRCCPNFF